MKRKKMSRSKTLASALALSVTVLWPAMVNAGDNEAFRPTGTWYVALDTEPFGLPPGTNLAALATFHRDKTFLIEDGGDFGGLPFGTVDTAQIGSWLRAALDSTSDPFARLDTGIWVDRGAGLELVAVEKGPVPGVPGESFARIDTVALERDGTVVFSGQYGDSASRTVGVFRQDPDGSSRLLFKEGDQADIDGLGSDIRTIATIDFDLAGSSEAGEKAFEVAFDDGSIGIYTAQILAPPPPPPECGDGSCDPGEDPCSCAVDCGEPPATELDCADLVDADCDGTIDCADADCATDAVCSVPECQPRGAVCSDDVDCCSGKCRQGVCRG